MNLNRRTVFAALASLAGITSVASFAPAQAAGMDPESARMEDDCMWEAVARNGSLYIFADGDQDTSGLIPNSDRCTPMRDDPALRALVSQAVEDGRLMVAESNRKGVPVVWTLTLKGRLYACEKTLLGDPDQVHTLRQLANRWGWDFARQSTNARAARLVHNLSRTDFSRAVLTSHEPFVHDEFAGLIQRGYVYPIAAVWTQTGAYLRFKPTDAARSLEIKAQPNLLRRVDTVWGYTPTAPVRA